MISGDTAIYPLSVIVNGAYGIREVCLALPSRISRAGVETLELDLTDDELAKLNICAERVRATTHGLQSPTFSRAAAGAP